MQNPSIFEESWQKLEDEIENLTRKLQKCRIMALEFESEFSEDPKDTVVYTHMAYTLSALYNLIWHLEDKITDTGLKISKLEQSMKEINFFQTDKKPKING